jgi:RNA polymerase sigma-70 factor (ECF subfamily)
MTTQTEAPASPSLLERARAFVAPSDEQLMWRVRMADDAAAFARLVERWQPKLRDLAARMTGDPHRAEDLAQEAFVRLFAKRRDYTPRAKFSTYLWQIALNLCYDELRRRQRRPELSLQGTAGEADDAAEFAAGGPPPDEALADAETGEIVRSALARLPEIYRTVLVLRHYEDLKFREIAEVLEVPEGTVKSRMAEALTRLGRLLRPLLEPTPPRAPRPATAQNQQESLSI